MWNQGQNLLCGLDSKGEKAVIIIRKGKGLEGGYGFRILDILPLRKKKNPIKYVN
jgi:hypothetical protein